MNQGSGGGNGKVCTDTMGDEGDAFEIVSPNAQKKDAIVTNTGK